MKTGYLLLLVFALGIAAMGLGWAEGVAAANSPAVEAPAVSLPAAPNPSVAEQVDALQAIMEKDENIRRAETLSEFQMLRDYIRRHNVTQELGLVSNLVNRDFTNTALQKAVPVLAESLQLQGEIDKAESVAATTKMLDHAAKVLLAAKSAQDMDGVVTEVQAALDASRVVYEQDKGDTFHRIESANHFVKDWQNYLAIRAAGDHQDAEQVLRTLADKENTFMPVPRSEILRLATVEEEASIRQKKAEPPPPALKEPVIEVHSLEEVEPALAKIRAMEWSHNNTPWPSPPPDVNDVRQALENLSWAKDALDAKNYAKAFQLLENRYDSVGTSPLPRAMALHKEIELLQNELLIKAVQGTVAAPDLPPAKEGEMAAEYMLRLAAAKKAAADWAGLNEVLQLEQTLSGGRAEAWLQEDLNGLRAYLMGEKMEEAGETLNAICYYRQSLATLGKYFPAAPAAAKLEALKKAYPDVYQQAAQGPVIQQGVMGGGFNSSPR